MKRLLFLLALLCSPAAAQQTLPTLPAASTPLNGTELIYCVQGGVSSKCLVSTLGPGISSFTNMTITGSFTATGLVTNADLANASTTVNGATCTLGSSCTATAAASTLTGATLASGVTGSSLTNLGTLTSLGLSGVITDTQAIGATSTDGLLLDNATAATVGAQKWSPRVHWSGMGWKTNATAGSQSVDVIEELQPVQGAASPSANLVWSSSINGGAYGVLLTLPTGGGLNLASGNYQIGGSQIAFSNIASSLGCAQTPALTGDIASPAGSCATTLATVNSTPGSFGGANSIPTFTSNGKGLFTASGSVTPSIPFTELTGSEACSQTPAQTGDVTSSAGSCATAISSGAVTNADLANPSTTVNGQTCTLGSTCSTGRVLLNTLTASNSASLSDTTSLTGTYSEYDIEFINVLPVTNSVQCEMRVHSGGVFQSTSYSGVGNIANGGGGTGSTGNITTFIACSVSNTFNGEPGISGTIHVSAPSGTTQPKMWYGVFATPAASAGPAILNTSGYWGSTPAIDGFSVFFSSGNIASGIINVYGSPN